METEILCFATHEVEGIGLSKNVIKLCNSFYPWKYHPLLKAEAIKSLNSESLRCFSSKVSICTGQSRMSTPRAIPFVPC